MKKRKKSFPFSFVFLENGATRGKIHFSILFFFRFSKSSIHTSFLALQEEQKKDQKVSTSSPLSTKDQKAPLSPHKEQKTILQKDQKGAVLSSKGV